jgi:hypothetical protein
VVGVRIGQVGFGVTVNIRWYTSMINKYYLNFLLLMEAN